MVLETHDSGEGESHEMFVHRDYEERTFQGIRYWRSTREQRGINALDGTLLLSRESRKEAFDAELCPVTVIDSSAHGSVQMRSVRAHPLRLASAWHCLTERQTWTGHAPDGRQQFEHAVSVSHNERGQVTSVRALSSGEEVELQTLTYADDGRLQTLSEAGKGASTFSYDPQTGLLRSAESAEQVHSGVTAFDPVTDAIAQMVRDRGGDRFVADFRFDGRERLRALWDNSTGTSEASPSLTYDYRDATHERPGIVASTLSLGEGEAQVRMAKYFTASGDQIASAVLASNDRTGETLTFSDARFALRNQGALELRRPAALSGSAVASMFDVGYAQLRSGPELERHAATGLGAPRSSTTLVQEGVTRRIETTRSVSSAGVLTTSRENGVFVQQVLRDLDGRVLAQTDEEGAVTRMGYDALGRLTRVTLASGETQSVGYDELGRLARVHRDGIGETAYHYLFGTTLLEGKTVSDDLGRTERTVLYQLDHAGRVIEELHTLASTGEQEVLRYEYDGAIDGVVRHPGQRGHLTRAVGQGFDKRFVYDAADRLVRSETHLAGFRSLLESATYYANGADRSRTLELTDAAGQLLRSIRQEFAYDSHGRPRTYRVNGSTVLETHYGEQGQVERVTGPHGTTYYHYDASTLRERGLTSIAGGQATDLGWEYDTRGQVASEDYGIDDGATRTRTFAYSPRGFLSRVEDELGAEAYAYDSLGRRTSAADVHGARTQARAADLISLGGTDYQYDTLGRLSAKHGPDGASTEYRYGARGQLTEATLPGATLTFVYDHENQRVLKERDGVAVAAYVGEAYLDAQHLILPVKVGARVLGLLVDGEFEPAFTDLRGSMVRISGRVNIASAYGVRASHLAHAEALDYATRGYDAELGFVRMGVRDYDPELGEFVTPDPLFLSAIERCAASPVECNLYGYARGNPLLFVDPTGTEILPPEIQEAMEQGAREVSREVQAKADEARESALTYLKEQLRASADVRGQTDIRYKGKFLEVPDPKEPGKPLVKGAYEVSLAGRLIAGTDGMRFEGTLSIAGELEVKMLHPALLGSYAFGRADVELGRVAFNLKNGEVSSNAVNIAISGGLRYDRELKLAKNVEGKLRAEIGIVGRSVGEQAGRQYNVSAYGRARAEAVIGSYRRRDEMSAALRLYDSRAAQH